jgi:cytochrome c
MKLSRTAWIHVLLAAALAVAALFYIRLHNASGATPASDSASAGHRLAEAWCKDCHSIETAPARAASGPPDFAAIANQPSSTALSLKVFLQTSHRSMPNLVMTPGQADDLVNYILSLKRN